MGPPVVTRRWHASTIKAAIADDALHMLGEVPADASDDAALAVVNRLRELGWKQVPTTGGFAAGQPQYNFWVPLAADDGPKGEDDVLAAMNQQWRRNIRKAAKAGVVVTRGERDDLADVPGPSTPRPPSATTSRRGRWSTSSGCGMR